MWRERDTRRRRSRSVDSTPQIDETDSSAGLSAVSRAQRGLRLRLYRTRGSWSTNRPEMAVAAEQGAVTQLTVLQGEKLARFTGRRREDDVAFNTGPSIEVYIASIETFCSANAITSSQKKLRCSS